MLSDLKYALRQIAKNPGFTVVVVLSLAFGIGANTAIFGLVDDLVLKPLAVKNPNELILFQWLPGHQGSRPLSGIEGQWGDDDTDAASGQAMHRPFSLRTFEAFRNDHAVLADVLACDVQPGLNLIVDNVAETVRLGQLVSGNYFGVLGVSALRGRTLLPADDLPGAGAAAVISYRYWHSRFADDPTVIGKSILVNQTPVTIVGVMPPAFLGVGLSGYPADITLPLVVAAQIRPGGPDLARPGNWWLDIVGRLKPGVTTEQARASLEGRFQESIQGGVSNPNDPPHLRVTPGGSGRTEADERHNVQILAPLMGMVGLVLLAACANAANLLVARGAARRREFAMRIALGASRGRIIRQLLTESVILGLGGAAVGLLVSRWGVSLLVTLVPPGESWVFDHLTLDWRVLGFTTITALLTGIGFGLVPALRATRFNLTAEFQGGTRSLGRGVRSWLSKTLLMAQVALAMVLLVAAGLFAGTVRNLGAVDLGFNRTHLLFFSLNATPAGYPKTQFDHLDDGMAERIGALPGVRSVTFSSWPLVSGYGWATNDFSVPGSPIPAGRPDQVTWNGVGANFFPTYEIPIVLGRGLVPADEASGRMVAVINQTLARKYFAGENPVGQFINLQGRREIVGVVRDMKESDLRTLTPPTAFIPFAQVPQGEAHFAVRTTGEPQAMVAGIRRVVGEGARNLSLANVRTSDEQVQWRLVVERIYSSLAVVLGVLALGLVCVGLYGLMSYTVFRRTGEIGLRMALGALPSGVLWMVLREALTLVCLGAGLGLATAIGATRLISSFLYGISASDPLTYVSVTMLLIGVATLACLIPARRAAHIDPIVALRIE